MKIKRSLIRQAFEQKWCPRCGKVTEKVADLFARTMNATVEYLSDY